MTYQKPLLSLLFNFLSFFLALNASAENLSIAVGSLNYFDGWLDHQNGVLIQTEQPLFVKSGGVKGEVKDLYSDKKIKFKEGLRSLPVARNENFSKILFQSLEGQHRDLSLMTLQGSQEKVVLAFKFPVIESDPGFSKYYRFAFSADEKGVFVMSEDVLLFYSFDTQEWRTVLEAKNGEFRITEIDSGVLVGASPKRPDEFIVKRYSFNNGMKVSYLKYNLKDLANPQLLKLSNFTSLFIGSRYLVDIDSFTGDMNVYDLETQEQKNSQLNLKKGSSLDAEFSYNSDFSFFKNEEGQILGISGSVGLKIYNLDGQLIKETPLGKMTKKSISLDGKYLFIDSASDNKLFNEFYIYDIANDQKILLPRILKSLLQNTRLFVHKGILYYYFNNKVFKISLESQSSIDLVLGKPLENFVRENPLLAFHLIESPQLLAQFSAEPNAAATDSAVFVESISHSQEFRKKSDLILAILPKIISDTKSPQFEVVKNYLKSIKNTLLSLSAEKRDEMAEGLAVEFTNSIRNESEFMDINPSKFANVMKDLLKPLFLLPSGGRTDILLTRQGQDSLITPMIFATGPIDEDLSTLTPFGFYMKKLPAFSLSMESKRSMSYSWTHDNRHWTAEGAVQLVDLSPLINKRSQPSYGQLWSDKKLTGIFVLSSNLSHGFEKLSSKIISYYKGEGFNFGPETLRLPENNSSFVKRLLTSFWVPRQQEDIANGAAWLEEKIKSGQVDYLVKEAHSGGNDEVVWLAKKNKLIKGTRRLAHGTTEEIYLLVPSELSPELHGKEVAVKNEDFGQWIRTREQNGGQELIYINASCWSSGSALRELIAAKSPLLVEIATTSTALTFENKPGNQERVVVDFIRKGKSYSDLKEALEMIKESKNPYILPNEEVYNQEIWMNIRSALDYEFEVISSLQVQ